jgi:hypothetical protein
MNKNLTASAWACKLLSIAVSVVLPWMIGHHGVFTYPQTAVLAALALIPNRWLVFSRISFVIFVLITLFPFFDILLHSTYKDADVLADLPAIFVVVCLFGPLPLSLVFSRLRYNRGEKFMYV